MIRGCASVFLLYLFFGNPTLATHGWWVTQSGVLFSRKSTGVRQDLTSVAMATSRSLQVTTNMHAVPVPKKKKRGRVSGTQGLSPTIIGTTFDVALPFSYLSFHCANHAFQTLLMLQILPSKHSYAQTRFILSLYQIN